MNRKPPQLNPYVFTVLLAGFGVWCTWDGWFTSDPEMLEHAGFNRVASAVLLTWAVLDLRKVRRWSREDAAAEGVGSRE